MSSKRLGTTEWQEVLRNVVQSRVWHVSADDTRLVWVTMLALADALGRVETCLLPSCCFIHHRMAMCLDELRRAGAITLEPGGTAMILQPILLVGGRTWEPFHV